MAADAWLLYGKAKELLGLKAIDLSGTGDTFKCDLVTSGYTPDLVNHTAYTDISGNVVAGSGYATFTMTVTWTLAGTTVTWDSDNPQYSASGGSIVARYAVMWNDTVTTPVADPLMCYSLLDNSPADISISDGNTGTISISASGVFQAS